MSNKAYDLYCQQPIESTRTLLDYVYSNSIWRDGKLLPNYRKPFDLISEAMLMQRSLTGGKFDEKAQNEIWLTEFAYSRNHLILLEEPREEEPTDYEFAYSEIERGLLVETYG